MKWFLPIFLFAIILVFTTFIVRTYSTGEFTLISAGWPALFGGLIGGIVRNLSNTSTVQGSRGKESAKDDNVLDSKPISSIWTAPITWVALVVAIGITTIVQLT